MRLAILLFASVLLLSCQGEKKASGPEAPPTAKASGPEAPPTAKASGPEAPPTAKAAGPEAPPTAKAAGPEAPPTAKASGPEAPPTIRTGSSSTGQPPRAPYLQTPTLPISPNAKPVELALERGGSLILPKGSREIRVDDNGEGKPVVRHYYLNHPLGRGLKVTEYPLKGRPCEALIASREAAFEAGHGTQGAPAADDLQRFHKGARCDLARAACYFSDTSRRTAEEREKGGPLHREAAFLLCKDDVAISVTWKVPDGAEVDTGIIDALSRIAGTFTTR
jgi:hypothetical protein